MTPKPAIFVFTTAYHPFIGGSEIAIQEVARRLADEFRFCIVTARLRSDLPKREARPEGTIIRVGFGAPFDKWLLPFLGPWAWFRERAGGRCVLWGMDISAGALAAAAAKTLAPRACFVFTIQYGYGGRRLRRGRLGAIGVAFRWMLGEADAVTAISKYLAEEAAHFGYRRPVHVLHNGVPLEEFIRARRSPEGKSTPTIITSSRLVPKNGVDIIIRAIPEVQKSFPDVRCHILGSGPERERLEDLAQSLGVTSAVTFFSDVPYVDLPRYLAAADVFVRPSRSEGMGNAFVDALAAGLPVVGTPVEGILDIIEDGKTGLFARVDDPADVAEKIVRLLRDNMLARRIVDAGTAMIRERFSWDAVASGYAGVFRTAFLPRILIATPMLPPDIGGPGAYASRLIEELLRSGHTVSVLSYGSGTAPLRVSRALRVPLNLPPPIRLFRFGAAAWRMLRESDVALALDPVAVGWPLAVACRMRGRPFMVRVEGDALWERYVERTGEDLTLRQFYTRLPHLTLGRRERAWHRMAGRVLSRAGRIVFSSHWRVEVFKLGYPLRPGQALVIEPPFPRPGDGSAERDRTFVFAGRFVRVKNIPRFLQAFRSAADPEYRLELIGDGPQKQGLESRVQNLGAEGRVVVRPPLAPGELRQRIASAHAFVLPSLSDVSPNTILDCIATATPFLLTRETGFHEALKDVGVFVDPLDERDIAEKLRLLMDETSHATQRQRLAEFRAVRSWEDVTHDWLGMIRDLA